LFYVAQEPCLVRTCLEKKLRRPVTTAVNIITWEQKQRRHKSSMPQYSDLPARALLSFKRSANRSARTDSRRDARTSASREQSVTYVHHNSEAVQSKNPNPRRAKIESVTLCTITFFIFLFYSGRNTQPLPKPSGWVVA
jgi:hypothetical protein